MSAIKTTYKFNERPAAKSSTSVLTNVPGNVACRECGCRDRRREFKRGGIIERCQCKCHKETT